MPTNPMSIIVTYIKAYAIKNRHIELQQVNNTIEPLKRFDEKVKKLENQKLKLDGVQEYTILLTITTEQSRNNIVKYMSEDIRNIYDKFKKYKSEEYEIEDGCYLNYYCQFKNEEIIDNIIDLWLLFSLMIYFLCESLIYYFFIPWCHNPLIFKLYKIILVNNFI